MPKKQHAHGGRRIPGPGKRLGRPPAQHKLIGKTLRMSDDEWRSAEGKAKIASVSVNELLRQLVRAAVLDTANNITQRPDAATHTED